jgi:hypothetical protein
VRRRGAIAFAAVLVAGCGGSAGVIAGASAGGVT